MSDAPQLGIRPTHEISTRDAAHVSIVSVIAGESIKPGQGIGIFKMDGGDIIVVDMGTANIGIADPFLTSQIAKGERFWMCMRPNTVSAVRHVWSHPQLPDPPDQKKNVGGIKVTDEQDAYEAFLEENCRGCY